MKKLITKMKDKIKKILNTPIDMSKLGLEKPKEKPLQTKEIPGTREMAIQQMKFFTGTAPKMARHMPTELPGGYADDKIVLQTRDPWWIHAYWEVTLNTWAHLKKELGDLFYQSKKILRVYDVSQIIFDGSNAHRFFDIEVTNDANNWYIDTSGPGRSWCVDYGLLLPGGRFVKILRSNVVTTPLDGPSWITDEEWMIPDDMFGRLYGLGIGFGKSSPVGKLWQERLKREIGSGALFSVSSPAKKVLEKKFWLTVNTELIVYGATEPDAKVTVQNRPIQLRPDGTFSLRFTLPDGKQVIPVKAVSADASDERTITPIVTRETK
jgi:hypothetical protein